MTSDGMSDARHYSAGELVHVTYVTDADKSPRTFLLELELVVTEGGAHWWDIVREVVLTGDGSVVWRRPTKKHQDFITSSRINPDDDLGSGAVKSIDAATFEAAWNRDEGDR